MPSSNLKIRSNLMLANVPENSHLPKSNAFRFLKETEVQLFVPGDFAVSIYAHKKDPRARDGLTQLQRYEYEHYMPCHICKNICVGTCESGQGDSVQAQEREAQIQALCAEIEEHRLSIKENSELRPIFQASPLFKRSPFWHWIRQNDEVMNNELLKYFSQQPPQEYRLQDVMEQLFLEKFPDSEATPVFCTGDHRFILQDYWIRLAPHARQEARTQEKETAAETVAVEETQPAQEEEPVISEPVVSEPAAELAGPAGLSATSIVRKMKEQGLDPLLIRQLTGLSLAEIEKMSS